MCLCNIKLYRLRGGESMQNLMVPDFKSTDSEVYKLYLYLEEFRMSTESRLGYLENQLEILKKLAEQT